MWRSSKRLIVSCVQFVIRCGRGNLEAEDLDDISDYDVQDVPSKCAAGAVSAGARRDLERNPRVPPNAILILADSKRHHCAIYAWRDGEIIPSPLERAKCAVSLIN